MNAATYLRMRREAAGLTIGDVATMMSANSSWRDFNVGALVMIEAANWVPTPSFTDRMRQAFAFDRFIVRQLVCRCEPVPDICVACGCSDLDPCEDEQLGACAWTSAAHDLCTHCVGKPAGAITEETDNA